MFVRKLFFVCALATASLACASPMDEEEAGQTEDAVTRLDSIDRPTDTGIQLLAGRWHDNVLAPTEGWHAYHYTATETGYVRFVMKAPVGHAKMWSYLRIEHEDPTGAKPWLHNTAGVGNTRTNLCEIIMKVQAGAKYTVVTTSQHNLTNPNARRHISDGPYTVAVLPLDATLRVPE